MKKMACEICESYKILKTNGFFVCEECGAKYSTTEAKKLLRDVDSDLEEINESGLNNDNSNYKTKSDDYELLNLKHDLYSWLMFFDKCHELEKTFEISADNYNNEKYIDIIKQEPHWKNNVNNYYNQKMYPQIRKKFIQTNPNAKNKYNKHKEDVSQNNSIIEQKISKEIDKLSKSVKIGMTLFIIGGILIGGGWLLTILLKIPYLVILFLSILIIIIGVIKWKYKPDYSCKDNKLKEKTLDDFLKEDIVEYGPYVEKYKGKFFAECESRKSYIRNNIPQLKELKENMFGITSIPKVYCNEYDVRNLLLLIINGRATTLKEMINLYETEKFRSEIKNELKKINNTLLEIKSEIQLLNMKIDTIETTVNNKLNTLIKRNDLIITQLYQLNYTAKQDLIVSVLSD